MTIKERIQALLKLKDISAVQMEKDLGFAKGYISKLDKASPSSEYILRIADYLGVTTDSILKDDILHDSIEYASISLPQETVQIRQKLYQEAMGKALGEAYSKGLEEMIAEKESKLSDSMTEQLVEYFNQLPESLRMNVLNLVKATAQEYKEVK